MDIFFVNFKSWYNSNYNELYYGSKFFICLKNHQNSKKHKNQSLINKFLNFLQIRSNLFNDLILDNFVFNTLI